MARLLDPYTHRRPQHPSHRHVALFSSAQRAALGDVVFSECRLSLEACQGADYRAAALTWA